MEVPRPSLKMYLLLFLAFFYEVSAFTCNTNKIYCVSSTEYQMCTIVKGQAVPVGVVQQCPANYICMENAAFACGEQKTPAPAITAPACFSNSIHGAEQCNQYWECERVFLWFEPRLKTCDEGSGFDPSSKSCSKQIHCTITTTTTTTTTPAPDPAPACYGDAKYPGPKCDQFYVCVSVWLWWEPRLMTCPDGSGFDVTTLDCSSAIDCYPTTTTSTTTTIPAPTTYPACSGYAKYPAPECNEYYECQSVWVWWEPKKITCPDGQGYDVNTQNCSPTINCQSPKTTTLPNPTTTTTTTTIATTIVPDSPIACSGASKHASNTLQCNQYYECISVMWWWEPVLQTCPSQQAFDPETASCISAQLLGCTV